jgi:hypothetical protein
MPNRDEAERFMALFRGHPAAHGTHGEPTQEPGSLKWRIKGTAQTVREPVTIEIVEGHLRGLRPLGAIPIDQDGMCRWGSIDYDVYDADVLDIVERVQRSGLPLVPGRSKSGGLHLYLFLKSPAPAGALIAALRDMAAHLGLVSKEIEIFPKQDALLASRGDVGNWIIIPYFGAWGPPGAGTYGGKIREQYGLKKTGAEMTLGEFLSAGEAAAITELPAPRAPGKPTVNGPSVGFADGPPCLQHLVAADILDDGRKCSLFMMGIYYKKKGGDWRVEIDQANQQFMKPPLPAEEVLGTIRSLAKRDYQYTCKTEPMHSHCDSRVCRFRRYGVGDAGDVPRISGLSVLETIPRLWFVNVGEHRLEIGTDDLLNYDRFKRVCFEQMKIIYKGVKRNDWEDVLRSALDDCQTVKAPPELSDIGIFGEWLSDYCTDRAVANRREDMLRGVAWFDESEQVYWFQLKSFMAFLKRERHDLRGLGRNLIGQRIRQLGGRQQQLSIKAGINRSCWCIPAGAFEPAAPIDAPPRMEDPI